MLSYPSVLISILNWNNAGATARCLESLALAGYLAYPGCETVVTDNGSGTADAQLARAAAEQWGARYCCNATNLGFAGGHNGQIEDALARGIEFVWLVNNDCLIEPGTLQRLLQAMQQDNRCGAASPCLAYEDSREVYFAGARQDWRAMRTVLCPTPWDESFHLQYRDAVWLVGTAVLFRVSALRDVGVLNASLFAYYEDDDIGERLRIAGWRSVVCQGSVAWHNLKSKAEVRRPAYFYYLMSRNALHFYRQFTPGSSRLAITLRMLARAVNLADILRTADQAALANAVLLGLYDGLVGRMGPPDLARGTPAWFAAAAALLTTANRLHGGVRGALGR